MHGPPGPFPRRALWPGARAALQGKDVVLDRCMAMVPGDPMVRIIGDPFVALVSGFCHLIWPASQGEKMFLGLMAANDNKLPVAADIVEMDFDVLKQFIAVDSHAQYLRDIAMKVVKNPELLAGLDSLSNADVEKRVRQFKGVGPWMAGWILMYHLARPDVLLLRDASLVRAVKKMYGLNSLTEQDIRNLSSKWGDNPSAACWYIFMAAEKLIAAEKKEKAAKATKDARERVKSTTTDISKPRARSGKESRS